MKLRRFYEERGTEWVRLSNDGAHYVFTRREGFCLSGWPTLASYARKGWKPWRADAAAGERVFAAYQAPHAPLSPWFGLWCDVTGQSVMPEVLSDPLEVRHLADSRLKHQWRAFEDKVPRDAAAVTRRFGNGFVAVLRLLAVCPEALSLSQENAAIFFALAQHFNRAAADPSLRPELLRLVRGPQRAILDRCGFVGTESSRQVFRKLDPIAVTVELLSGLSRALADPVCGRWLPMAPLRSQVLELFRYNWARRYLTLRLVNEIAHTGEKERDPGMRTMMEQWAVFDLLGRLKEFHRMVATRTAGYRAFSSLREVYAAVPRFNPFEASSAPGDRGPFPAPPLQGTPDIVPITSTDSLVTEGSQMRNCAGNSWHQAGIRSGNAYFYRVYQPQRCTLRLEARRTTRGKAWVITEIRTRDNGEPGLGTLQAVCDALGVPANPDWHPADCVWSRSREYACVPRGYVIPGKSRRARLASRKSGARRQPCPF